MGRLLRVDRELRFLPHAIEPFAPDAEDQEHVEALGVVSAVPGVD